MVGLRFDFEAGDLVVGPNGAFEVTLIDSQNVALISVSQICILTEPELGAQVGSRIVNAHPSFTSAIIADAKRQAERDGAKGVRIILTNDGQLTFTGTYED